MLVIGIGNDMRGDDAAGLLVARAAAERGVAAVEEQGDATALIERWDGEDAVVLVDSMRSGAEPGTIARFDASDGPIDARPLTSTSTHMVGVGEAIELARTLGRLPPRVVVLAVEGADFGAGAGLSTAVEHALGRLVDAVLAETVEIPEQRDGPAT